MFETIERQFKTQMNDLMSIVNDVDEKEEELDLINSMLDKELNEKLQNIELVNNELDEELRKQESLKEFEKLDENGFFSEKSLIDFTKENFDLNEENNLNIKNEINLENKFKENQYNFIKNCETIEEKDEITEFTFEPLSDDFQEYFNLSRINLNSVIEEDEEDSSQNDENIFTSKNELKINSENSINNNLEKLLNEKNEELIDAKKNNTLTNDDTYSFTQSSSASLNTTNNSINTTISLNSGSFINLDTSNSNVLVNNIIKRGLLYIWQESKFVKTLPTSNSSNSLKSNAKRIFFSIGNNKMRNWKSRYFMLTENYLLCFKKGDKSNFCKMGKYQFKLNLLDDIEKIELNQNTIHGKPFCLSLNEGKIYLFDKDPNCLSEWLNIILKTRQRCELIKQEQELKFEKEKMKIKNFNKEHFSERIERKKIIINTNEITKDDTKFRNEDEFEYINNLRKKISSATSVFELNRSHSNLVQPKTNTPIINNRKRMSLQRKSLLSQFDLFLNNSQSSKQFKNQSDNIANLANLANLTNSASKNNNNSICENQNTKLTQSPTMLPRIAPQCQGTSSNAQLTNSCSVFHFGTNPRTSAYSPFSINNSPALKQRSLYAEKLLSNSSLTLSNFSRFSNSRNSTLGSNKNVFSNSIFKPFRESIHYATSLRSGNKDLNSENKSHLKSATSEFSFIRLSSSSNTSTLNKNQFNDDTLKRKDSKIKHENNYLDTTDHFDDGTLRNCKPKLKLNSELSRRTIILSSNDLLGKFNDNFNEKPNNYDLKKTKKLNNSLDESDSSNLSSSNSSSCSSNNFSVSNKNDTPKLKTKNLDIDHPYQKLNKKNRQSNKKCTKKKSNIPVLSNQINEPIYQSTTNDKRKSRMNKILESQSKIYVTMADLK